MENELITSSKKRPNHADVARLAGVSRATVSYALNGRRNVTVPAETRERVLEAVRALDYKPNTLAQSLKAGKTKLIGVFLNIREDSFHDRILHGIHEECAARGYSVLLAYLDADEAIAPQSFMRLLEFQISGAIRIIGSLTPAEVDWLGNAQRQYETPFVMVDDRANTGQFDSIVTDDVRGARTAVKHLIDLGHRRIAHITGGSKRSTAPDRLEGYRSMMAEAGFAPDESLIRFSDYVDADISTAMAELLALPDPPTALFVANDRLAALAREYARSRGIKTPEDLSIVGYGDLEIAAYTGLTSIDQDPELLGRLAVQRIFARIEDPTLEPHTAFTTTRLVQRASTAPYQPLEK